MPLALQHRALLDVYLEERADVVESTARGSGSVEVDAVLAQGVLQTDAVLVREVLDLVDLERSGEGGRAEQAAPEARALLVREVDELDGARGRPERRLLAQDLDGGHHAERAIQPATPRHGIDVRSEQRGLRSGALHRRPDVAALVRLDLDRQVGEEAAQEVAGLDPVVRPRQPPRTVGPAGQAA